MFFNVLCLLTDSEIMLKLKGKNASDIYCSRFGIDGCSKSYYSLKLSKQIKHFGHINCSLSHKNLNTCISYILYSSGRYATCIYPAVVYTVHCV